MVGPLFTCSAIKRKKEQKIQYRKHQLIATFFRLNHIFWFGCALKLTHWRRAQRSLDQSQHQMLGRVQSKATLRACRPTVIFTLWPRTSSFKDEQNPFNADLDAKSVEQKSVVKCAPLTVGVHSHEAVPGSPYPIVCRPPPPMDETNATVPLDWCTIQGNTRAIHWFVSQK